MDPTYTSEMILFGGGLMSLGLIGSILSSWIGMPLLLGFLVVGMLAGNHGLQILGIQKMETAYLASSIALAVILFEAGLSTRVDRFRMGAKPAIPLATFGVLATSLVTGLIATVALDIKLAEGLLIGAMVGSTDAAAVFSLLRARGVRVKPRVAATLEVESSSNDPMAMVATVVLVGIMSQPGESGMGDLLMGFLRQFGAGIAIGIFGAACISYLVRRLRFSETDHYPLLVLAGGLIVFGMTGLVGGSGFLAIYLAGLILGNHHLPNMRTILRLHTGIAWLSQIALFLVLGLLANPQKLIEMALPAMIIAMGLMLVARPLAVFLCLLPFRFSRRERIFISWVGLRGAVPIVLAMFPHLAGLPNSEIYLDIAFFVVIVSLIFQGGSIIPLARRLRLEVPLTPSPDQRLEIDDSWGDAELHVYRITDDSRILGRTYTSIGMPQNTIIAGLQRNGLWLEPEDIGRFLFGDTVYLLGDARRLEKIGRLMASVNVMPRSQKNLPEGEFILHGTAKMHELAEFYDLPPGLFHNRKETLAQFMAEHLMATPAAGDRINVGDITFTVTDLRKHHIHRVAVSVTSPEAEKPAEER